MSLLSPTLHMLCGKIAAGKSTLATKLARADATVLIAEDTWLDALFSDTMTSAADYLQCAAKLRMVMGPHVSALLNAGMSVVLDFPANTVSQRDWMRSILEATQASHQLHLIDIPDALCLKRLQARNAQGDHPFAASEAQFHQFAKHFAAPLPEEGFNVLVHKVTA